MAYLKQHSGQHRGASRAPASDTHRHQDALSHSRGASRSIAASQSSFPHNHLIALSGLAAALLAVLFVLISDSANSDAAVGVKTDMVLQTIDKIHSEPAALVARPETMALAPKVAPASHTTVVESNFSLPDAGTDAVLAPNESIQTSAAKKSFDVRVTVKKGDHLAKVFKRAGATGNELNAVLKASPKRAKLTRIHPNQEFIFTFDERTLIRVSTQQSKLLDHHYDKVGDAFVFNEVARATDTFIATRNGQIKSSLFLSAKKAGMSDKTTMNLANIFGYDIDFALDIRENDSFKVVYEEHFVDGKKVADGNVLAAEFVNKGKTFRALRYRDSKGDVAYFTPEGASLKKAFLRTPIDFARISSHFNLKRKHPVLNRIRAHKGTDYAAARGTPIKSAGDGKVVFRGWKGGYGNVLIVQHGQKYKTLYAHISKFSKRVQVGSKVKQGQVVAYVGSTGLATGPHLHYEFYVNGRVRNPVTVKLPEAKPIAKSELARFKQQTATLLAQIEGNSRAIQFAKKDRNTDVKKL